MEKTTLSLSTLAGVNVSTYGGNFDLEQTPEDFDLDEFKKELLYNARFYLENFVKSTLEKHGLKFTGFEYYMPKFYNYDNDSLDITYEIVDPTIAPELLPKIKEYIENEREDSRDGYMSLEPDKVELVKKDDYAFLWAIFDQDELKDKLDEFIEAMQGIIISTYDEE